MFRFKHAIIFTTLMFTMMFAGVFAGLAPSYAQFEYQEEEDKDKVKWELHESATGIFSAKFPEKYGYRIFPFQFNPKTIAFSGEIISTLDGGPPMENDNIVIKVAQTFGGELTFKTTKKVLEHSVLEYRQIARAIGGQLITDDDIKLKGFMGKKLYISYTVDDVKYGVRVYIFITNYAKLEYIVTGLAETLYSYKSEDFINSITPIDGIKKQENEVGIGWTDHVSRNNIFTVKLPPVNIDYMPKSPVLRASPKRGIMRAEIVDPVINKKVFFSVSSYKLNKLATPDLVKPLLFSNHISRYVKNASIDTLKPEHEVMDKYRVMRTHLVITPPKSTPYANTVILEALYVGNTVIVKEFLSSSIHAKSGLKETLFGLVEFHPEKYKPVKRKKKNAPSKDSTSKPKTDKAADAE